MDLRFFNYEHLSERLQRVSRPVGELAREMDKSLPDGEEKDVGLRKLLEAKDAFVRAALMCVLLALALPALAQETIREHLQAGERAPACACADDHGTCLSVTSTCSELLAKANATTLPPGLPVAGSSGLPSLSTVSEAVGGAQAEQAPEPEDGMHLGVLLGGQVSLSGRAQTSLAPLARVEVDGPIPFGKVQNTPWLRVRADFTALPGESIELQNPETFRALQFSVSVSQRVFRALERGEQRIRLSVFAEGGFATRLPHDPAARDRSVRWGGGGLRLEERSRGAHISVALTGDQRLDGVYRAAVVIDGAVQLWRADEGELKGAKVSLIGQAILGLQIGKEVGAQGDVVGVGIAVGR